MKQEVLFPTLLALLSMTACSKYYGCDEELDCQNDPPSKGTIVMKLSAPFNLPKGDSVRLEVRRGTWEDGKLIYSKKTREDLIGIRAELQHRYTAEASYATKKDSLHTYDSGRLDLEDFKNCGEVCYKVDTLNLDLKPAAR